MNQEHAKQLRYAGLLGHRYVGINPDTGETCVEAPTMAGARNSRDEGSNVVYEQVRLKNGKRRWRHVAG